MGGDSASLIFADSPPSRVPVPSNECPRCGKVAASAGHTTFDEWLHCVETFRLNQQLTRWASEWDAAPPNSKVSLRPVPQ